WSGFLQASNPKRYPDRKKEYDQPVVVNWVNGAFMFFRSSDFDAIGGFDTNVFLYFEEMDLGHRLRKIGKQCVLHPGARILHYQGVSIGRSREIDKEAYISYLYVVRKNRGWAYALMINLYLILVCLIKPKNGIYYQPY
ncbi:glycosyltransferase family 2 protein, partial [Aureitalea marina]